MPQFLHVERGKASLVGIERPKNFKIENIRTAKGNGIAQSKSELAERKMIHL